MRDVRKLLKLQPGQDPSQALAKLQQDLAAFQQAQPTTDPSTHAPSTSSDAQTQLEQLLAQLQQLTGTAVSQPAPGADSSASSYSAPTQAPVAGLGGHHHGHHALKAVAAALQESPQELQAQLQSGQSVTDLAQAKGITDLPAAVAASIGAGKNTSLTDEQKLGLANAWLTDVQNTERTGDA